MNAPEPFVSTHLRPLAGTPTVSLHVALKVSAQDYLGDEVFRLVSFSGKEQVSQGFEYELELHGNTTEHWSEPLSFERLIGRPVTVGIHVPVTDAHGHQVSREDASNWFAAACRGEATASELAGLSFFNGIVGSFAVEKPGVYKLGMRSALCKLALTNAYKVHQGLSLRGAIAALMQRHRIEHSVAALVGTDNPAANRVQDWLQAGESDAEYLQRLMGRGHIYYFHVHGPRSHQVVFANRPAYPEALPGGRPLRYCDTGFEPDTMQQFETLIRYSYRQSLTSGGVQAQITREDAAWEADTVAGLHSYRAQAGSGDTLPFHQVHVVQYGGSQAEVAHLSHTTQSALSASARELSGASLCPHLRSGHRFCITQLPRMLQRPALVRPELEGLSFVLTQVQHEATLDGSYRNEFTATDAQRLVLAFNLSDTQQGSLLGQVVAGGQAQPTADWRYGSPGACNPAIASLKDEAASPSVERAQGVLVQLATAAPGEAPVWVKLAAHMQTVPEVGATVVVGRSQDQSELPEVQSIIQSNVSQVIMPSGWTASTTLGSSYNTSYGDNKSIRFGLHSKVDLAKAVSVVEGQYASGQYREASFAQGASYSHSQADAGRAGLLSRSESTGSTYSTHDGAVSSSQTSLDVSENNTAVLAASSTSLTGMHTDLSLVGTSQRTSITGTARNTSVVGVSTDMNMVGSASHTNLIGISTTLSMSGSSTDISMAEATTHIAMKGVSTAIEMTDAGINMQLTGTAITLKITLLDITL